VPEPIPKALEPAGPVEFLAGKTLFAARYCQEPCTALVAVDPAGFHLSRASIIISNQWPFRRSSRVDPLNVSMKALSVSLAPLKASNHKRSPSSARS
jgi:hypothetical protein